MTWHHSLIHVFHSTWNLHKGFPIEWQKLGNKCKSDVFNYFLCNIRRSINQTKYYVDKYWIWLIQKFCSCSWFVENILFLRQGLSVRRNFAVARETSVSLHNYGLSCPFQYTCLVSYVYPKSINPDYPLCPD